MNVRRGLPVVCAFAIVTALQACQTDKPGEEPPPTAPTGEAAPATPATMEDLPMARGHAPDTAALPQEHPPIADGSPVSAPDPGSGRGASGIVWKTPSAWVEETPSSSMRRGQYRIPGPGGDAELAIFYFGAGQGGDAAANAQRWAGQFTQPGGGDPLEVMKTQTLDVRGTKVLLVETTGTYVNTAMGAADVGEKPNYALLGAVVPGPDANWFFKMTGPQATVQAQRDGFLKLLQSIQKGA
jgi:hypothetical protein